MICLVKKEKRGIIVEERLLDEFKKVSVEELVNRINEIVRDKFSILDEENDIEKWNRVPKLLLLSSDKKKQVLSFVEFMDSLLIPVTEKAMYVISLCGLLEYGNLNMEEYDDGSLFTLASFYENSTIDEIKNTIAIANNKDLLLAVRKKTLDIDTRNKILAEVITDMNTKKITVNNKKDFSKFMEDTINKINEKDYYDLVK
jgi:hypothetical protein